MRALLILACAMLALLTIADAVSGRSSPRSSVAALLTETNPPPGFAYALAPRSLNFPRDHGAHPRFRSEWWYFTGNLADGERAFGFQLTIFRFALRPQDVNSTSPWRSNQIYLGHFAVSDIGAERFFSAERRARAALNRAGVKHEPAGIWITDWRIDQLDPVTETWRLTAEMSEAAIDLIVEAQKPIVLQGDRGLSQKSSAAGNASYYYSIPRFAARGALRTGTREHSVTGSAWFDHEWSTSALADGQVGWDWFSLQLEDGRDLMFYQIRNAADRADTASHGVIVGADGKSELLLPSDIELSVTDYWKSVASGGRYPARWRMRIREHGLDITIAPRLPAQEWHKNFTYWEGAVAVTGEANGAAVGGHGYVELVGYE